MTSPRLSIQIPPTSFTKISFPAAHVLLITLSRPSSLNCINSAGHRELDAIWNWLDAEPSLRVGVITGEGRAFCAGADLKEWNSTNFTSELRRTEPSEPSGGFGGLSRRSGKKPIIAAVNGICFGGGCEMIINADMVIASPAATFALPEVKRGVIALAGGLTRLVRTVGRQRAMEMALTGRVIGAEQAREWGLCNAVVEAGEDVVQRALEMASLVADNSPDSVIISREGLKMGWDGCGVEEGTERLEKEWFTCMEGGENMKEGIRAFVEKRKPQWIDSKL